MKTRIAAVVAVGFALSACTSPASKSAPGTTRPASPTTQSPEPLSAHPACIISADCPAGSHCDLQQCVQDCNTVDPCTGALTCSPRARCLSAGAPDVDPTPTATSAGSLTASPTRALLTDRDTSLAITLTSTGTAPVRYRVVLSGAHLSIADTEGTFAGSTKLVVNVDPTSVLGQNQPGSVTVISTLGEVVVDAPIHAGITGNYKGELEYDGGPIRLGASQVAVDVLETSGAVQMRLDPQDSMLFPAMTGPSGATEAATGQGLYTISAGLDATVAQVYPATFGGSRNPFDRDIGRSIRFQLRPDSAGNLSGTFTETIVGLFANPITSSGHVSLTYVPQPTAPGFTLGTSPAMPSPPGTTAYPLSELGGFNDPLPCAPTTSNAAIGSYVDLATYETTYATPTLDNLFAEAGTSATGPVPSYDDVSTVCKNALALAAAPAPSATAGCGVPQEMAYALVCGATTGDAADVNRQTAVGRLVQETLAGPLLVAKNEVVDALQESFTTGPSAEMDHYDTAMAALGPYATWVLQPAVLEFVRTMAPQAAAALATPGGGTSSQPYPAARALSGLFRTMASIDGERTRVDAATNKSAQTAHDTAQARAVLSYLEILTLQEILNDWGTVPDSIGSTFTGALTPLDQSFQGLLEGANAFGIPDGFVPFVFRPAQASAYPTNFEQALALAKTAVAAEQTDETAFLNEQHTYAAQVQQLHTEMQAVQTQYVAQLQALCGASFDPSAIKSTSSDWSSCGADNAGAVGEAILSVQAAQTQLQDQESTIHGMGQKITIDTQALAQVDMVNADTISAVYSDGQQIATLDFQNEMWSAAQSAIAVAANAQTWNGGAPLAEAALDLVIGGVKASLTEERDQAQTDQTIQIQVGQQKTADIQAGANIAKEKIDADQALIDLNQQQLAILSAQGQLNDKVRQAQETWQLMQEQVQLITEDPTQDPSYRLMRDSTALKVLSERAEAQQALYLAASALAYEVNEPIPNIAGAVLSADNASNMNALESCLQHVFDTSRVAYGSPQDYVTTVSVRQMLGITGPRTDDVTRDMLTEGDQFRQILLKNENLDGRGGVGIRFSTDLQPGNGLWADDVCEDRVATVQAQLVGDELGDNQAQVNIAIGGTGLLRSCGDASLIAWSFGSGANGGPTTFAVVQAGVNTYGDAPANSSLFGQPVARSNWLLTIPGGADAPSNTDVDLTHIDDIVLRIDHQALAKQGGAITPDFSCLSTVGN